MTQPQSDIERGALDVLEAALDKDKDQQAAYIDAQTSLPEAVRARAHALLAAHHGDCANLYTGGAARLDGERAPPSQLGAYKIGERLGRGGMGAVYLARRTSGDFDHLAAIKLIKPGLLSDTLIKRFRRERQVLAALRHPNIAQLYDGGETDDGTPYFVMEYIEGLPLPRWAEDKEPSDKDKLALFLQICDAVEFAHQNLVIHRDLTPSNVLVTHLGQAKLIDFGIAKPPTLAEAGQQPGASIGTLSLTPGYAAPERSTSSAANTLTDIYSLGRILETLLGASADAELYAIIHKAAAAAPAERYSSVRALCDDIQRYQSGFAVRAFSIKKRYRLGKFLKRNALTLGVVGALFAALAGGLVATSIAYKQAEAARADAAARFEDVRALAKFQLFDLYDQMSRVAGNTQARGDLANEAQRYLAQLASQPDAPASVQIDTINGYIRLGRIMGVPSRPSLGEPGLAADHLGTAERLLEAYEARGLETNEAYWAAWAQMHAARALVGIHEDMTMDIAQLDIDDAQFALNQVPLKARGVAWHEAKRALLYSQIEHADMSSDAALLSRYAETLRENAQTWPQAFLPVQARRFDEATAIYTQAIAAYVAGDHSAALPYFTQADAAYDALDAQEKNDPVTLYMQAWTNYIGYGSAAQLDDFAASSRFIEKSQAITDRLRALEERDAMVNGMNSRLQEARAQYLAASGDMDGAIKVQQEILRHYKDQMAKEGQQQHSYNVSYAQISLAFLYRDIGALGDACSALKQAYGLLQPEAETRTLPAFMARAASELPKRIALCDAGKDIGSENTMFEEEGWGGNTQRSDRAESGNAAAGSAP